MAHEFLSQSDEKANHQELVFFFIVQRNIGQLLDIGLNGQ
jgi:hypothetical protein